MSISELLILVETEQLLHGKVDEAMSVLQVPDDAVSLREMTCEVSNDDDKTKKDEWINLMDKMEKLRMESGLFLINK